ncbi:MAG: hypothetical protein IT260_01930 [Saprospiraceae bacterium]|nr:hypothetical protein [Saprospiraceae bacterium]
MLQPYFLLPALALLLACQGNSQHTGHYPNPASTHFSSLHLDSLRAFPLGQDFSFYGTGFLFSPFEKNKVWFCPDNREAFELDLESGSQVSFPQKFGHSFFQKSIRADGVHPDAFEPGVCWFLNFHEGVFRYDRATGRGQWFDVGQHRRAVICTFFDDKQVWIGTSNGLWRYERQSGACRPVEHSPNVWITQLSKNASGHLLIGHGYTYDPESHCWTFENDLYSFSDSLVENHLTAGQYTLIAPRTADNRLCIVRPDGQTLHTVDFKWTTSPTSSRRGWPLKHFLRNSAIFSEPPYFWTIDSRELLRLDARNASVELYPLELPRFSEGYRYGHAPGEIWFVNSRYWLAFDKQTAATRLYHPPLPLRPVSLLADSDCLYLLGQDSFVVVRKQFLIDHYAGDSDIARQHERFNQLVDSLRVYQTTDWAAWKAQVAFLQETFQDKNDPVLRERLAALAANFQSTDEKTLRALLAEKGIHPTVLDNAYNNLILLLLRRGQLRPALALCREFQARRPESPLLGEYGGEWQTRVQLETAVRRLDSIGRCRQPAYESEWAKGQALQGLCMFVSEGSCYDFFLSDSIYRALVRRYPNSPRADDAAYQRFLNSRCYEGEDGSNHPEEVQYWAQFLKRYPGSHWRPQVLAHMTWALDRTEADLRKGLRWLAEAERLQPSLFAEGEPVGEFLYMKQVFQQQLDWFELDFVIALKKSTLRRGEPVELTFSLRNTGLAPKTLPLLRAQGFPNFSVDIAPADLLVNCVKPLNYQEATGTGTSALPPAKQTLLPGKTYQETWDLAQTAWRVREALPGRFVFDQPGVFLITAHFYLGADSEKVTKALRLEVE